MLHTKNYQNLLIFHRVIKKTEYSFMKQSVLYFFQVIYAKIVS